MNSRLHIKSVLIFLGGDTPKKNIIPWKDDLVIAADAGVYNAEKWNVSPDVIIGDFDSISREEAHKKFPNATQIVADSDKDYTDAELAIRYVEQECNSAHISCVGGIGGRLDHFIELLFLFKKYSCLRRIIGEEYHLEKIVGELYIDCRHIPNKYISFFPMSNCTKQISRGLRWELNNLELSWNRTSSSNEYKNDEVYISMLEGELLGIWAHGNVVAASLYDQTH